MSVSLNKMAVIAAVVGMAGTLVSAEAEGRRLAGLSFESVDQNDDGYASMEEYQSHGSDIFYSMDSDDDGVLSWGEFESWGFGMANVAEDNGREQAYETARKVVFDLWDRSVDWKVSKDEHRRGIATDFFSADEDRDGRLSREEYLKYSIINVTLRSALKPDD